jgi:hypothetical protein
MRYALAWRLHCGCVLATTVGPGLAYFQTFLRRGEEGITESTYLGAAIPGQFCPNFGYHSKPINNLWPTPVDPLPPFSAKIHVSSDAQDYAIVTIDVHGDRPVPIQALRTKDEVSAANHRSQPLQPEPPVPPVPLVLSVAPPQAPPVAEQPETPVAPPVNPGNPASAASLPPPPTHGHRRVSCKIRAHLALRSVRLLITMVPKHPQPMTHFMQQRIFPPSILRWHPINSYHRIRNQEIILLQTAAHRELISLPQQPLWLLVTTTSHSLSLTPATQWCSRSLRPHIERRNNNKSLSHFKLQPGLYFPMAQHTVGIK